MEKIITRENLSRFAYVNDKQIKGEIRGIVIDFKGLGDQDMFEDRPLTDAETDLRMQRAYFYSERNLLYLNPYTNPWSWCNRQALAYTEEVLDVLFDIHNLPNNIPIASTGSSMGGMTAIAYTRYAKRTPITCVADCPSCEVEKRLYATDYLARTVYSSVFWEEGTIEEAIRRVSPLDLMDELPKIPYHVIHCELDGGYESRKTFVDGMKERGCEATFFIVPGRGHCDLSGEWNKIYCEYAAADIDAYLRGR